MKIGDLGQVVSLELPSPGEPQLASRYRYPQAPEIFVILLDLKFCCRRRHRRNCSTTLANFWLFSNFWQFPEKLTDKIIIKRKRGYTRAFLASTSIKSSPSPLTLRILLVPPYELETKHYQIPRCLSFTSRNTELMSCHFPFFVGLKLTKFWPQWSSSIFSCKTTYNGTEDAIIENYTFFQKNTNPLLTSYFEACCSQADEHQGQIFSNVPAHFTQGNSWSRSMGKVTRLFQS